MSFPMNEPFIPIALSDHINARLQANKPSDLTPENGSEKAVEYVNGLIKGNFLSIEFVRHEDDDVTVTGVATQGKDFTIVITPQDDDHFVFIIPTGDSQYEGNDILPIALINGLDNAVLVAVSLKEMLSESENWKDELDNIFDEHGVTPS